MPRVRFRAVHCLEEQRESACSGTDPLLTEEQWLCWGTPYILVFWPEIYMS